MSLKELNKRMQAIKSVKDESVKARLLNALNGTTFWKVYNFNVN